MDLRMRAYGPRRRPSSPAAYSKGGSRRDNRRNEGSATMGRSVVTSHYQVAPEGSALSRNPNRRDLRFPARGEKKRKDKWHVVLKTKRSNLPKKQCEKTHVAYPNADWWLTGGLYLDTFPRPAINQPRPKTVNKNPTTNPKHKGEKAATDLTN